MIQRARAAFGTPSGLRWAVRGFDEPIPAAEPFDAAVCLGNSLALAPDLATAERAIGRMFDAVRPGGLVIVQVLNLWRLADGPCLWQKVRRMTLAGGEAIVVKGVHRAGSQGFVDLIVADAAGRALHRTESAPLLGLEAAGLEAAARRHGARSVDLFGGYGDSPYERSSSPDLVIVARR